MVQSETSFVNWHSFCVQNDSATELTYFENECNFCSYYLSQLD